jgi:hypothetical protein
MKPISFAVFALCAATVCSTPKVQAETVAPQLQDVPQMQSATIDLRNIKPSVMAYWLDPQRETLPNAKKIPLQVDASLVVLPEGIDKIEAFDNRNELVIRGTEDGVQDLRELVDFLDKPIPMIEIQVQYIHLSKAARALTSPLTSPSDGISVTFNTRSQYDELQKLIASGKAQIIGAPRITTWNKMQAKIVEERQHFYVEVKGKDGGATEYLPMKWQRKFETVPTLNQDGTLTVDIRLFEGFAFKRSAKPASYAGWVPMVGMPKSKIVADDEPNFAPEPVKILPAGSVVLKDSWSRQMNTTANLKDGDTLLINGLSSREPSAGATENTADMLLVTARLVNTARLVHDAEDEKRLSSATNR